MKVLSRPRGPGFKRACVSLSPADVFSNAVKLALATQSHKSHLRDASRGLQIVVYRLWGPE